MEGGAGEADSDHNAVALQRGSYLRFTTDTSTHKRYTHLERESGGGEEDGGALAVCSSSSTASTREMWYCTSVMGVAHASEAQHCATRLCEWEREREKD